MKEIVNKLIHSKKTISTMESCTGGALASSITDIEGASEILKFSAVTYSNEFKIKFGVDKNVIDKYTVYSMETAQEMSRNIVKFTNSNYGVGITGQMNRKDKNNETNEDNIIYISIYDKDSNQYYNSKITAMNGTRKQNKEFIIKKVEKMLESILIEV